jgi:hypothetical protein
LDRIQLVNAAIKVQQAYHSCRRGSAGLEASRRKDMARILAFLLVIALGGAVALADRPVPPAEAEKIQAALKPWGCSGGKMEQETEASGVYEVDDAKCHGGQYDIKLDKGFKVISIIAD